MNTPNHSPSAVPTNGHTTTVLSTFSQIEVELAALISEMEVEIAQSGTITQKSASNLHAFRRKVEGMLTRRGDER